VKMNVGLIVLALFLVLWLDYEYSLHGIPEGSIEREKVKHEVHLRSAQRLRDLCFKNGGIYIKLGQHLGQLVYFGSNCVVKLLCTQHNRQCLVVCLFIVNDRNT